MKRLALALATLLTLCLQATSATPDASQPIWEQLSENDGIIVYRWEAPDSPLFAFKAVAIVDAPVSRVASVLVDTSRRKEWVPNLIEVRTIRNLSPRERIEYMSLRTPPFTKNRDFLFKGKAAYDEAKKELVLSFTSIEDPEVPETDMIRGRVIDSAYTLRAVDKGAHTELEYLVHIDPRGNIAKWIVNLVQKNIPRYTIEAIRRQVAKPDVIDQPTVKALFEK